MIISRNVTFSEQARDQLERAQIAEHDERVQAIVWYLKHDVRLSALRQVGTTASTGEPLFAYQTATTRLHPRLVIYLTVSGSMQNVVIHGVLLPTPDEDWV